MKIDLFTLTILDAIDRNGSFEKAAQEVHRVRSALTYTVKKLEQAIGMPIFDRSGHRAQLTPEGRALLEEGRYILQLTQQLEEQMVSIKSGIETQLSIAYNDLIPFHYLTPFIQAFKQKFPQTQLTILAERLNGTIDVLNTQKASLCIGVSRDLPRAGFINSFAMQPIKFVFAISPKHPLAKLKEPLKSSDILKYDAIVATDSAYYMPPRTVGVLESQKVLTVNSIQAKLAAHIAGLGVGFLPEAYIEDEVAAGKLVIKQTQQPKSYLPLHVAWNTKSKGKALQWCVDYLKCHKEKIF